MQLLIQELRAIEKLEALGVVLVKDIARSDVNEDKAFKIRGLEDI